METREQLKNFFNDLRSNEEARLELENTESPGAFHKGIVEHGNKMGYDFSETELRELLPEDAYPGNRTELTDKELDQSTGANDDWIGAIGSFVFIC